MIRKLKFPIKFKLTVVLSSLVALTTSFYLYIAFDLYKKDKTAYIYDSTLSSATSRSLRILNFLDQQYKDLRVLKKTFDQKHLNTVKTFFNDSAFLVEFGVYQLDGRKLFRISTKEFAHSNKKSVRSSIMGIKESEHNLQYFSPQKGRPGFFQIGVRDGNKIYRGKLSLSSLLQSFYDDSIYTNILVDSDGILLSHDDLDENPLGQSWMNHSYVKEVMTSGMSKGVIRSIVGEQKRLVAYNKLDKYKLYVFSSISEDKSFEVIQTLINKTVYTALFIVSLAILLSLFMAKIFTSPISELVAGTLKIAKGEFDTSLNISSNDEIGILSDSFNHMSKEILRFTGEMKEKIRMENELNVAKLVQSSFFPDEEIILPNAHLASFYQPASECGGDWWGYVCPDEKHLILMVGDATGHGVPAALATATANCCANNLKEMAKTDPSIYQSSAKILRFFNRAVSQTGGNILMTFMAAIIDFENRSIKYSNAGHNPALLCNYNNKPRKEDIIPLAEANGLRLGIDMDAQYSEAEISYEDNSYLVLYTDGLIEGKSAKNQKWNTRMFYNTIVERDNYYGGELLDAIISKALSNDLKFYRDVSLDDDLTLVTLHLAEREYSKKIQENLVFKEGKATISRSNRASNIETISDGNLSHFICGFQPDLKWEQNRLDQGTLSFDSFFTENDIMTAEIFSSEKIIFAIDELLEKCSTALQHQSYKKMLRVMALELTSNAVFNAPLDNKGHEKYHDDDRRRIVNLLPEESVSLSIAVNEHYAAVSVMDRFGTLSKKQIIESILRGTREKEHMDKPGGAGLGLFMIYCYANKILVERCPNQQLRFTALIHNEKRFKRYSEMNTSFHFFEKATV